MAIAISNLNSATSMATESFLTELQSTDTTEVFGGSGEGSIGIEGGSLGESLRVSHPVPFPLPFPIYPPRPPVISCPPPHPVPIHPTPRPLPIHQFPREYTDSYN
jgi:hypothetical protein